MNENLTQNPIEPSEPNPKSQTASPASSEMESPEPEKTLEEPAPPSEETAAELSESEKSVSVFPASGEKEPLPEPPKEQPEPVPPPTKTEEKMDPKKRWYVIHTLSGHEQKVHSNLLKRIDSMHMKEKIFSVLVPTEEEMEIKNNKKRIVKKKIFPGYVLVEMIMNDDSWYVVRNTSGVTGFVSSGSKPIPLPEEEVKQILKQTSGEAPRRRLTLKIGDKIRITSGPFVEFYGAIQEVNPEKEKIKVLVSIFGRETPVELDYAQAERL